MPRITIVTQWYPPEQAPFGRMMQELAGALAADGWEVTVITGLPNHPGGVVFGGYRKAWLQRERAGGVSVLRVWLATGRRRTVMARLATFVSFTLLSSWRLLREPRPDIVFAVLQPLSLGLTLPLLCRLKGSRLVLNLQDLHPDAQIRLGMVHNRSIIGALRAIESHAYRSCTALTVICERFREHALARGASEAHTFVVENWIDTERIRPLAAQGLEFRSAHGFSDDDFVVAWAGTLGHVCGAGVILEAAQLLRDRPQVRFLIVGEGPLLPTLRARLAELQLSNVTLLPFQPESHLAAMQSCASVSLVTLAPDVSEVSVPSKVLAYFAAGRPVIACVPSGSETARLVQRSAAGIVVSAADPAALAAAIQSFAGDAERVQLLGSAARAFAVDHLSPAAAVKRYESIFSNLL